MRKVWLGMLMLGLAAASLKAELSRGYYSDIWVDSMYQKLTIAEQVGQLLDVKVEPTQENLLQLINDLTRHQVGFITVTGGEPEAIVQLVNSLRANLNVPVFVTVEEENALGFPFEQTASLPKPETYLQLEDPQLLLSSIAELSGISKSLGISANSFSPVAIEFSEVGMEFKSKFDHDDALIFQNYHPSYYRKNFFTNTDFYFNFTDQFAFSPKLMGTWNSSLWKDKLSKLHSEWQKINDTHAIITIKSLPQFPEDEASYFDKKVITPLFWKYFEFGGILSADLDAISGEQTSRKNEETIRTLLKIGSDKILISSDIEKANMALMTGVDQRYFRQNEIKEKVKRLLAMKYKAGLSEKVFVNDNHLVSRLNSPEIQQISYEVYSKAAKVIETGEKVTPFPDLDKTNFASLSLGFSEWKTFQETLGKYAPIVHYMLPEASFDPYDLQVLSEQLVQFDHVIVGLHTTGLVSLDNATMDFLRLLNEKTNVILVFLGNTLGTKEFLSFDNRILMHEDNLFTQQIAAQLVFGALDSTPQNRRLAYSTPEMQGMDSKVLKKIDFIVNEAISNEATPGCQVLVARNGSVIWEKGYGYYTYDSIMPVDTRTIYDLASVTKVAATTQAMMKLSEEGKIDLNLRIGDYLTELDGSNKADLTIRDILTHQSGLRAFYPFWTNTIKDEGQILHYYKDKPNKTYANTVAYGMFSAEDLKDSLWHWTIDTKLRYRRHNYQPYDYKYSDLGFYMLQVLVERVAGKSLDAYMDSTFYKPLGVNSLSFNPLCKYPLNRITPTERDENFRHVLVWGTVHDQIAAMKGGVSGHAGLFGNAQDVAKLMQLQLQDGWYGGKQYFKKETIEKFTSPQSDENRRGLGWDKPEKGDEYNPASRYASFNTFGHRGFTGTVAWADPTFNLVYIFLSNRIYPDMGNNKLSKLNIRKRIQDVVYESMWSFEKQHN